MAKWNPNNLPSQKGRQVIITGGSSGIGYHTALALCAAGADVTIAVRNMSKGQRVVENIMKVHPSGTIRCIQLDVASMASVRAFAASWHETGNPIDTLILNAGISNVPTREVTADGFERQLATNYLGHFLLVNLLLDDMRKSSNSRIIAVASLAHKRTQLCLDDLQLEQGYSPMRGYAQSKLAILTFAFELARRLQAQGSQIRVMAVHPGVAATEITRGGDRIGKFRAKLVKCLFGLMGQSAAEGAWSSLYAATSDEVQTGHYYGPSGLGECKGLPTEATAAPWAKDENTARRLWQLTEETVGSPVIPTA